MAAIVELERSLKIKYPADGSHDLTHDIRSCGVSLIEAIIFPAQPVGAPLDFYQFTTTVVKDMT